MLKNRKIPARWVAATLLLVTALLAARVLMLDDYPLRLLLAGGDRLGLLAADRRAEAPAVSIAPAVDPAPDEGIDAQHAAPDG